MATYMPTAAAARHKPNRSLRLFVLNANLPHSIWFCAPLGSCSQSRRAGLTPGLGCRNSKPGALEGDARSLIKEIILIPKLYGGRRMGYRGIDEDEKNYLINQRFTQEFPARYLVLDRQLVG